MFEEFTSKNISKIILIISLYILSKGKELNI